MIYDWISGELKKIVDKVEARQRVTAQEAIVLWEHAPLSLLGVLATGIKREKSGKEVYYNQNFHLEPTNICRFRCRFCSYRREKDSPEAWDYSMEQMEQIARGYVGSGITEVHVVGGVHPDRDLNYYVDLIRKIKEILPNVVVKAFTAVELNYMIKSAKLSLEEGLKLLKDAGMRAIPGGGAEVFAEEVRSRIAPEKGGAKEWLALHEQAHKLDIPTNATILYGHVESVADRIDHLRRLRELQDKTGGFDAFIPLKYRSAGNEMGEIGEVGIVEDMKMLAISRIFLDNFPHIKAYWPMYGKTTTELALAFGVDDIDGTIGDTTKIYSMAGAEEQKPAMTIGEIESMVRRAGMVAVERDTFYNRVQR